MTQTLYAHMNKKKKKNAAQVARGGIQGVVTIRG
jgi:hypothetical protein